MSEHPKRENYASDGDFLDAMADYHGIDRRMLRHITIPMMTHDDDTCPHLVRANLLESENARLKAEVERLTSVSEAWKKRRLDKVEAECINWAEVEKENANLKAEVERLTKAGDAMVGVLGLPINTVQEFELNQAWHKAKGGQS